MTFSLPQLVMIVLLAIDFVAGCIDHVLKDRPRWIFVQVIDVGIMVAVLWWGGFWG